MDYLGYDSWHCNMQQQHMVSTFFESMVKVLFENHHKEEIQTILSTRLTQTRHEKDDQRKNGNIHHVGGIRDTFYL